LPLAGDFIESFDIPRSGHPAHGLRDDLALWGDDHIGGDRLHVELSRKDRVLIEIHFHRHIGGRNGREDLGARENLGFHLSARPTPFRPKMDEDQPICLGSNPAGGIKVLEPDTLRILGADRCPPPEHCHHVNHCPKADLSHGTHSQENGNVNTA
jgi:hypothetical protein